MRVIVDYKTNVCMRRFELIEMMLKYEFLTRYISASPECITVTERFDLANFFSEEKGWNNVGLCLENHE